MTLTSRGGATSLAQIAARGSCVKHYTLRSNNMTVSMIIVLTGLIAMVAVGTIIAVIMTGE
jgi:hypothetical protein